MRTRSQLIRNTVLLIAALLVVNLIAQRFKFRFDLTADKRYSLSPATINLLKNLPEAVTVSAYFTEKMPPDLAIARQDFKDLLVEYAARANGNLVFEFIDPNSADSLEMKAQQEGIQPLMATTREKDKAENLQVYMGCTVRMGERKATVPTIQQGSALEWAVSSAIKEVSTLDKPIVGLMQGHGEQSLQALNQLIQSLSVMYSVQPMAIYDSLPINDRFHALVMVGPTDSIPPMQLDRLHEYLARGKGVVIAYDPVRSDLGSTPVAEVRPSNLAPWLERHGLRIDPSIIVDQRCNQVQVMQQMGNFSLPVPIAFHYFPVLNGFADHPISNGLDVVVYQFCSPIVSAVRDTAIRFTPVLFTSEKSGTVPSPQIIDIRKQWTEADFPLGPQAVGAEVVGSFGGGPQGHLILFTNGGFCVSGTQERPMELPDGNINLMVNAVDRATGQNDLMGLRGKEVNYRPIDDLSDATRSGLKWMNLLLPVLVTVIYGIGRRAWRRAQRIKRMAPEHVR